MHLGAMTPPASLLCPSLISAWELDRVHLPSHRNLFLLPAHSNTPFDQNPIAPLQVLPSVTSAIQAHLALHLALSMGRSWSSGSTPHPLQPLSPVKCEHLPDWDAFFMLLFYSPQHLTQFWSHLARLSQYLLLDGQIHRVL